MLYKKILSIAFVVAFAGHGIRIFYKEYDATQNASLVHACLMSLVANSIILFVVLLIYLLMVIGLLCWGRIPTGNILFVYASQYEELLSALGVNAWLLLLALFLFF